MPTELKSDTARSKAKSALNSLRHGLTAKPSSCATNPSGVMGPRDWAPRATSALVLALPPPSPLA